MINVTKRHQGITFASLFSSVRGILDISRIVWIN